MQHFSDKSGPFAGGPLPPPGGALAGRESPGWAAEAGAHGGNQDSTGGSDHGYHSFLKELVNGESQLFFSILELNNSFLLKNCIDYGCQSI